MFRHSETRWFLALLALLSGGFYLWLWLGDGASSWGGVAAAAFMWTPGLAALLARQLSGGTRRPLGWRWGASRWQLAAYALPVGLCLTVYPLAWLLGPASLDRDRLAAAVAGYGLPELPAAAALAVVLLVAPLGVAVGLVGALGEELGWRGLLLPRLAEGGSFAGAAAVSGLIWALWHLPLLIVFVPREPGAPPLWFAVTTFTLMVVGLSFPLAWLRLESGSLWTAVVLHASFNAHVQGLFDRLTVGDTFPQLTGELGLGLAAAALLLALLTWRLAARRGGRRRDQWSEEPHSWARRRSRPQPRR